MENLRKETNPYLPEAPEDGLTSLQKLEIIRDNPLTGFIPKTHEEKSHTITLLSNVNKANRNKINTATALNEIFNRQKREKSLDTAEASIQSIVFEWGDFVSNARDSISSLSKLEQIIDECPNPNIKLTEEVDRIIESKNYNHPGYKPLIRYLDLLEVIDETFDYDLDFDPLHTYEDRPNDFSIYGHKNKTIEDEYTSPTIKQQVDRHIMDTIQKMYLDRKLRTNIKDAVLDEQHREKFWVSQIIGAKRHLAAKPVAQLVLAELTLQVK